MEYNRVALFPATQWEYILHKVAQYKSASWEQTAVAFGADLTDLCVSAGTFFQILSNTMKLSKQQQTLWEEMLSMTMLSPYRDDDVRRIKELCRFYAMTEVAGGVKYLRDAASAVRSLRISIMKLSKDQAVLRFLGEEGITILLSENTSLSEQDAIDAVWVLAQFITFCVKNAEMISL